MSVTLGYEVRIVRSPIWLVFTVMVMAGGMAALDGPNVCMVEQKYNITKRIKYRAPMAVRTYEWCFSVPPRCSRWTTEMRDLTRLETEERTAEVAVCCPGYKMTDVSCVPICPNGKTGAACSKDCPLNKWGPNCVNECRNCTEHGSCSPVTGECRCQDGWKGESCEIVITTTVSTTTLIEELLTSTRNTLKIITTPTVLNKTSNVQSSIIPATYEMTATTSFPYLPTTNTVFDSEKYNHKLSQPTTSKKTTIMYFNSSATTGWTLPPLRMTTEKITTYFKGSPVYTEREHYPWLSKNLTISTQTNPEGMLINQIKNLISSTSTTGYIDIPDINHNSDLTITKAIKPKVTTEMSITTYNHTTMQFKPKEIWIKPAQKGEHTLMETKNKHNKEQAHQIHRIVPKKESITTVTTPKTIVVSIIPTSVSYSTFKKIALTTSPHMSFKNNLTTILKRHDVENNLTKSMNDPTPAINTVTTISTPVHKVYASTSANTIDTNITKIPIVIMKATTKYFSSDTIRTAHANKYTNSMLDEIQKGYANSSTSLTLTTNFSNNVTEFKTLKHLTTTVIPTTKVMSKSFIKVTFNSTTEKSRLVLNKEVTAEKKMTMKSVSNSTRLVHETTRINENKSNDIFRANASVKFNFNSTATNTTAEPPDEETFHILTEPEHITAVMGEKGTEKTSIDLMTVTIIAGGVMITVITVAVVVVMIERCRRPRYEEVRKINDIHMQVMIENNDMPPPYVRSIFHTPLPDPPSSSKCHYQPISTLDRNLKQFMRPVVVQAISPVMLENFRDILECHYDHLPRRTQHFETLPPRTMRSSIAPSMEDMKQLRYNRPASVAESTIEALKCEAKFDVIDSTTAEPLYAEIPCWRPPSEHAIEVVPVNGEAVTEL